MNDVTVTVSGFAGNTPALHMGKEREWTMFRVASTRRFRNENGDWADGPTLWFTIKAWRSAAQNVVRSVRKGDPVVVTGRLEVDEWTAPDGAQRTGLVINASAVGVDAMRGRVEFSRVVNRDAAPDGPPENPDGSGELVPVSAGDADPFGLDALVPAGSDTDVPGDPDDQGDRAGVGQRELVTA